MTLTVSEMQQIQVAFDPLNRVAAVHAWPKVGELTAELEKILPSTKIAKTITTTPRLGCLLATASVEMWHRSVHSFLISAGLTTVSPIWASVAGYYSSHYSIRAFAHLLGHFQLFHAKRLARAQLVNGQHSCEFGPRKGVDREHRFYWRVVKENQHFSSDPLFTMNVNASGPLNTRPSDVGHRDMANYRDHVGGIPIFEPLTAPALRARVDQLSQMPIDDPPIPDIGKFPDLVSVQIVAYHRLVRYRALLNEILGGTNRFWSVHQNPPWAARYLDFQITEMAGIRAAGGR